MAYVRALQEAGVRVEVLPALSACPDSIFVEDTALTLTGAIVLRPGAPTRAGEARDAIRDLPNIMFVHFADLKRDLPGQTRAIEKFLDIDVDAAKWPKVLEYCSTGVGTMC